MLANWTFLCLSGCSQPSTNATDFGSYKLRGLARFTEVLLFAFWVASWVVEVVLVLFVVVEEGEGGGSVILKIWMTGKLTPFSMVSRIMPSLLKSGCSSNATKDE